MIDSTKKKQHQALKTSPKKRTFRGIALLGGFMGITALAQADLAPFDLHPYIGAEVGVWHLRAEKDYGERLFKKYPVQGGGYLGLKLNRYLGLEFGGEYSKQNVSQYVDEDETFLDNSYHDTEASFVGDLRKIAWTTKLVGFFPLDKQDKLQLFGTFGIKKINMQLKLKIAEIQSVVSAAEAAENNDTKGRPLGPTMPLQNDYEIFKQAGKKYIPCAGIGLQYAINSHLGARIGINWEKSRGMGSLRGNVTDGDDTTDDTRIAKFKNSLSYALGIHLTF